MPNMRTDRLRLRPFADGDLDGLAAVYGDDAAMRLILGGVRDHEETRQKLDVILAHWEQYGYGYWAVTLRGGIEIIGECGLKTWKEWGETELHYIFASPHWGRGLATEAASAALRHGFLEVGLDRVVAFALPGNEASFRVMAKLGMKFERSGIFQGEAVEFYSVSRGEFEEGAGVQQGPRRMGKRARWLSSSI